MEEKQQDQHASYHSGQLRLVAYDKETKTVTISRDHGDRSTALYQSEESLRPLLQAIKDVYGEGTLGIIFSKACEIRSLKHMPLIAEYLPDCINLSFAGNDIHSLSEVRHLRAIKHLREVCFVHNPVAASSAYRIAILREIPQLQFIDGVQTSTIDLKVEERRTDSFLSLLNNKELYADIVIEGKYNDKYPDSDRQCYAHKGILALRCPKFAELFATAVKTEDSTLEKLQVDIDNTVLHVLLLYMYSDTKATIVSQGLQELREDTELLWAAIVAAYQFDLPELQTLCEDQFSTDLTLDTVINILRDCESKHAHRLRSKCFNFILDNMAEMNNREDYKKLDTDTLLDLLQLAAQRPPETDSSETQQQFQSGTSETLAGHPAFAGSAGGGFGGGFGNAQRNTNAFGSTSPGFGTAATGGFSFNNARPSAAPAFGASRMPTPPLRANPFGGTPAGGGFGTPATGATPVFGGNANTNTGGFSFGRATATSSFGAPATGGFGFGAASTAATPATGGFGAARSATSSFGSTPASGGFGFGNASTTTSSPATGGFGATQPGSGFGKASSITFGTPSGQAGGFGGFGSAASSGPRSSFGASSGGGFGSGASFGSTSTSTGVFGSTSSFGATTGSGFGGASGGGFGFGGASTAKTAATTPGFTVVSGGGFGSFGSATTTEPKSTPSSASSGGFGSGASFGSTSTSTGVFGSTSSFGTTTAATGGSFGSASGGGFGGFGTTPTTSTFGSTATSTTSGFGLQPAATGGLFSGATANPHSNPFGAASSSSTSALSTSSSSATTSSSLAPGQAPPDDTAFSPAPTATGSSLEKRKRR